jgi:hypothetical protein
MLFVPAIRLDLRSVKRAVIDISWMRPRCCVVHAYTVGILSNSVNSGCGLSQ